LAQPDALTRHAQRSSSPPRPRHLDDLAAMDQAELISSFNPYQPFDPIEAINRGLLPSSQGRAQLAALLTLSPITRGRALKLLKSVVAALLFLGAIAKLRSKASFSSNSQKPPPRKVAVIGAGIAGAGCAWALRRAGIDAVLFEKRPKLGGNAKSFTWDVDGAKVETGLAVLAYPWLHFHTYNELMTEIGMGEGEEHELKFMVAEKHYRGPGPKPSDGIECVFAHGRTTDRPAWLVEDLENWDRLVAFVKRVNAFMQPSSYVSLYRTNVLNPLNVFPLRSLMRMYGVSDFFWERVFVPVHTSTFLEVEMESLPAVMAELLDEVVPFSKTPVMRVWKSHANDVFVNMTKAWPPGAVRASCAVERVDFSPAKGVLVKHEDAEDPEYFDAVVFACSAPAMRSILGNDGTTLAACEDYVLRNTMYTVDRDKTFETGVVHSDAPAVLPGKFERELLDEYANYIEIDGSNPRNLENHFIISSWAPTMKAHRGKRAMLVSYNAAEKTKNVDSEWTVTSRDAHPCLTMWSSFCSTQVWPMLQGARQGRAYYCGSAITPANAHEFSLLSGFVAASQLGAPYPFPNNPKAQQDFERMRGMMLGWWA
jgi:predicted NAD/FAD-binding protein